jgi:eukaryotic-like serine/threonine-protein kinase
MTEFAPGAIVAGRFRIDRVLGSGGMSLVYAARHTVSRKRVALKVLRELPATQPATRRRFLREARAACAVHHPNVLEIDDVIELPDGTLVLVMDLLEGESLAKRLARVGPLPLSELAPIMMQVIAGVSAAHAIGIVHRDLKPENIFLLDGGATSVDVKVIDFGIAKFTARAGDAARSQTETKAGAMIGTPFYMSPEQVHGEGVDPRSDIWALGVILYEALSGVRPFDGETVPRILLRITKGMIVPIERHVPDLPPALASLIGRMLRKDCRERPSDLKDLLRVLSESSLRSTIYVPRRTEATASGLRRASQRPVAISTRPAPPSRAFAWALSGALALCAVAAVLLAVSYAPAGPWPAPATAVIAPAADSPPAQAVAAPLPEPSRAPQAAAAIFLTPAAGAASGRPAPAAAATHPPAAQAASGEAAGAAGPDAGERTPPALGPWRPNRFPPIDRTNPWTRDTAGTAVVAGHE